MTTNDGITVFNPYTETFKTLKETDSVTIAKGANIISACIIDKQNNIWVSTYNYGIYKINPNTYEKEQILGKTTDPFYLKEINDIFFEDDKNRIWMSITDYESLHGGLFYLESGQTAFLNYKHFLSQEYNHNFYDRLNTITAITSYNNNIYFASLLGGIYKLKFGATPIAYYAQSPMQDSRINTIYRSKNGILWIGTNGQGIELSIPDNTDFKLMSTKINSNFSIESVRAFAEDNDYYWIGGYYGLSKIKKDFSNVVTVEDASVYSLANCNSSNNSLWTGSEGGGLQPLNKINNNFYDIDLKLSKSSLILPQYIFAIHPVNDSLILLGTSDGLFGFNPGLNNITFYPTYCIVKQREVQKSVRTIYEDKLGNILIGYVEGGIGKLHLDKKRVEKFDLITNFHNENDYNPINSIYNDNEKRYWVATNNGLFMYDTKRNKSFLYTEANGLANSHIYGILPDEEGNIWLSTNSGLLCSPHFMNQHYLNGLLFCYY